MKNLKRWFFFNLNSSRRYWARPHEATYTCGKENHLYVYIEATAQVLGYPHVLLWKTWTELTLLMWRYRDPKCKTRPSKGSQVDSPGLSNLDPGTSMTLLRTNQKAKFWVWAWDGFRHKFWNLQLVWIMFNFGLRNPYYA